MSNRVVVGICDACDAEGPIEDVNGGLVMCKTGTGCNPRVVSGLDTAAAPPEPASHPDWCGAPAASVPPGSHAVVFDGKAFWGAICASRQSCVGYGACGVPAQPPPPARPSRVEVGPVKPTAVAVGQRWRDVDGAYTVVGRPATWDDWVLERDNGAEVSYGSGDILADEYLGTVPAPVSAPGQSTPVLTWPDHGGNSFDLVQGDSSKRPTFGNVPRQSTHVETPPTEDICHMCGAATTACACCRECNGEGGFLPEGACGGCDYCPTTRRCGACRGTGRDPNAPAPGAGEGPLSMGFAEACEVLVAERGKVQYLFGGEWKDWDAPFSAAACLSPVMVVQLSNHKWRIKPEPLPAPAPRVSPAEEIVDAWCDQTTPEPMDLARDIVEATLEAVRRETDGIGWRLRDDILDRARAAMLEPPACPGRRP